MPKLLQSAIEQRAITATAPLKAYLLNLCFFSFFCVEEADGFSSVFSVSGLRRFILIASSFFIFLYKDSLFYICRKVSVEFRL